MTPPIEYGDKSEGWGPESGPLDWMTASATAANDLVIASRESQTAGFMHVAEVSAQAAEFISTAIVPIADPEREATENILNELRVRLEALETAKNEFIEVVTQPQLREFQCRQELQKCLSVELHVSLRTLSKLLKVHPFYRRVGRRIIFTEADFNKLLDDLPRG